MINIQSNMVNVEALMCSCDEHKPVSFVQVCDARTHTLLFTICDLFCVFLYEWKSILNLFI